MKLKKSAEYSDGNNRTMNQSREEIKCIMYCTGNIACGGASVSESNTLVSLWLYWEKGNDRKII